MNLTQESRSYNQLIQSAQHLHEAVVITDASNNVLWVNSSFTRITGYEFEEVIGKNPRLLNSKKHSKEFFAKLWKDLLEKGFWKGLIWNKRKDNQYFQEFTSIYAVKDESGEIQYFFAMFLNAYDLLEDKTNMNLWDYYDSLTKLPNRNRCCEDVQSLIGAYQHSEERFALLFLDVDRFKSINDSFGYFVGDEFLVQFARRIRDSLHEKIHLYRFSGDEFVLVVPDLHNEEEILEIRMKVSAALLESFTFGKEQRPITAAIGVSIYPEQGQSFNQLKKNALLALDNAKKKGKNQLTFYHNSFGDQAARRFLIERELHDVIRRQELSILFQPQVRMNSLQIVGYEALIRWNHPDLGAIPPSEFIPIAEETGNIIEIGEWVLRTAIRQMMTMKNTFTESIQLSVNVSAIQLFDSQFIQIVKQILQETKYPSKKLIIEITETAIIKNLQSCAEILYNLQQLGVKISLDDFGTGFSSLTHLKELPLDCVKIDRSFVGNLAEDELNYSIVKSILELAKIKKMVVVAEGIEKETELSALLQLGCSYGQGFYFSKPLPLQYMEHGLSENDQYVG